MEYTVDCPYIPQPDQRTCWHASYKMLLRYRGADESLADRLPDADKMREDGIMDSQFHTCRDFLGLNSTRYTYLKEFDHLKTLLEMYGPIWVSGFYASGHKHIVILRGVRSPWYSSDEEVYINDPYRGITGAEARPAWWSFSYFKRNINPVQFACQHWP